jgi:hypothetical protein
VLVCLVGDDRQATYVYLRTIFRTIFEVTITEASASFDEDIRKAQVVETAGA